MNRNKIEGACSHLWLALVALDRHDTRATRGMCVPYEARNYNI